MLNREDIIRMASEAGFSTDSELIWCKGWEISPFLARFAALVAAAEREACARACETQWSTEEERAAGRLFAAEIRARSKT